MFGEDAYYFTILLMTGFSDGYDEWLNGYLEAENPLSDIVLNLALCGSDTNKTITCLRNFCREQRIDEKIVCDKLRCFLKEAYHTKRLSKEQTVSSMYCFAASHGDPGDYDFDLEIWGDMFYMDDYYSLAEDGIISWEQFDYAFFSYLDNGVPIDSKLIWNHKKQSLKSVLSRIKKRFAKKQ